MRYHYQKPESWAKGKADVYYCDHPVYNACTLIKEGVKGLAIIQQRHDRKTKATSWGPIDDWIVNDILDSDKFDDYFDKHSGGKLYGCYPTVTVRQIMWALRMKPLQKERWETVFDRKEI